MLLPVGADSVPYPRTVPSGFHKVVSLRVPCLPPSRRTPMIVPSSDWATSRHWRSLSDGPDSERLLLPSSVETHTWSPSL